jgi:superfamily II DNA or RNA helicase
LFYVADLKNNTFQMRCFVDHDNITDIPTYLRAHAQELGDRILESYPPLHSVDDPPSPIIGKLLRKPYPAQTLAIMGLVRRWQQARAGAVIAECGTGKTLISLAAVQTHAEDRSFTALAMVPPQLVEKWCREAILIRPGKSAPHRLGHLLGWIQVWMGVSQSPSAGAFIAMAVLVL